MLVDFNTATLHGRYVCEQDNHETLGKSYDRIFHPARDEDIEEVLDAMAVTNATIAAYAAEGISGVSHGLMHPAIIFNKTKLNWIGNASKAASPELVGDCREKVDFWTGDLRNGARINHDIEQKNRFGQVVHAVSSMSLHGRTVPNPMPLLEDVHECIERCKQCARCRAVSVSSSRGLCVWFPHWHRNILTIGRGVMLDHFVTVEVPALAS